MVGGIRGTFHGADDVADLGKALESLPRQIDAGFRSICVKPSMFLDDPQDFSAWCRALVNRVEDVACLPVVTTP